MSDEVIQIIIAIVATGAVSTFTTVIALRVHITYVREAVIRIEESVSRAHERIDNIVREQGLNHEKA